MTDATTVDLDTTTRCTQTEFLDELAARFGPHPMAWAFVCPSCGDIATGADMKAALAEHPRTRNGEPVIASEILGTECIGRTIGALSTSDEEWAARRDRGEVRGCTWCAYGLFRGPLIVTLDGGGEMGAFRPAPAVSDRG